MERGRPDPDQDVWLEGLKDYAVDGNLEALERIIPRLKEKGSMGYIHAGLNAFILHRKSEMSLDHFVKLMSFIDPEWGEGEEEEKEWWMP